MDPKARYTAAMHAMQSGVAMEMNYDTGPTEPKHLRVGVNSALVDHAALARVLIAKGLMTEAEYMESLAAEAEAEQKRYEAHLSRRLGRSITLA